MKKILSTLLACLMLVSVLAGCVADTPDEVPPSATPPNSSPSSAPSSSPSAGGDASGNASASPGGNVPEPPPPPPEVDEDPEMELVDGNWRFKETRKITVEHFDRTADIKSQTDNNYYTNWVQAELKRVHNIEVEYVLMPRWEEDTTIPLWLAAGDAPDICLTYNSNAIQQYANMGAVHDLNELVHEYKARIPHLWDLLGETGMYWWRDPVSGVIYSLETYKAEAPRINTFVREDWLAKLGLKEPTTHQEFEDMLIAFRDNAELLLGNQAARMIPFAMTVDVGWETNNLLMSFVPDATTDREKYIYGYDDRQLTWPGIKNGVALLNKWFNEGLIFKEFALIKAPDTTVTDEINSGHVGAWIGNWDMPYRSGTNGTHMKLKEEAGADAAYIAVDPFPNDAGNYFKIRSSVNDRHIFFPTTNSEPKASLFYLDFMSRPETIEFLQLGVEGINYDMVDGVPVTKAVYTTLKDADGNDVLDDAGKPVVADASLLQYVINSPTNLDLLLTINGYYPGMPKTAGATATSYTGVEPRYIIRAIETALNDARETLRVTIGEIVAESEQGSALPDKRNVLLANAVRANPGEFDAVWDAGMQEYLNSGGQAIINERAERWAQFYGDADTIPTE